MRVWAWFKKWVLDGWITEGPQVACPPDQVRAFARCLQCRRVFPHWWAYMKAEEAKKRGKIGCPCGGMKLQPCIIPAWQAVWWFVVRGVVVRKLVLRKSNWDPRIPVLFHDRA